MIWAIYQLWDFDNREDIIRLLGKERAISIITLRGHGPIHRYTIAEHWKIIK